MTRKLLLAIPALVLVAALPNAAAAKSVKSLISEESLTKLCTAQGVGEFNVTVTLPDGSQVTGSVHCEAEDIAGAAGDDSSSASSVEPEDDDASEVEDHHGDGSDDAEDDTSSHGDNGASGEHHGDGGGHGGDDGDESED